jgi:hypothetical protein
MQNVEATRIALAVLTLLRYLARLAPDRAAVCHELAERIRVEFELET